MADGSSFFDTETVADLRALVLDGLATRTAFRGATALVLDRWGGVDNAEPVALPAQDVLVTFADRAEQVARGDASTATLVDGMFERAAPFDVETGDQFVIGGVGEEMPGTVVFVRPPELGIVRAGWTIRTGRA